MSSTRITRHVHAPRPIVYRAFLDAHSVSKWMVPNEQIVEVVEFETTRR